MCGCSIQQNLYSQLLNGMKEKVLYRQKAVNDMLRVTVNYYAEPRMLDEQHNLLSKMAELRRKLHVNGLTSLSEDESKNTCLQLHFNI